MGGVLKIDENKISKGQLTEYKGERPFLFCVGRHKN